VSSSKRWHCRWIKARLLALSGLPRHKKYAFASKPSSHKQSEIPSNFLIYEKSLEIGAFFKILIFFNNENIC
jgi:hypothetical protein